MRITWGKLRPGSWDEYEKTYMDVMAGVANVPGLKQRWLARDIDDPDAGFAVSLWEGRNDFQRYEESDLRSKVLPRLQPFFVDDFKTYHCEVRVPAASE
jgi:heme-degrading monooxygenase HmoA